MAAGCRHFLNRREAADVSHYHLNTLFTFNINPLKPVQ